MASIEKMDKKLGDLQTKLEAVQQIIKSKKETEKKLLKEIADIEAKRNSEIFGDMSKAVQQENIEITPDDVQYMIAMLKEHKRKTALETEIHHSQAKDEYDHTVSEPDTTEHIEPPSDDSDEPFPIKNPFVQS